MSKPANYIDEEMLSRATPMAPRPQPGSPVQLQPLAIDDVAMNKLLDEVREPVLVQQQLAARIKAYLDQRMMAELSTNGQLSQVTLQWVRQFDELLNNIQRNMYGDKSVQMNINVSHAQIAAMIRKHAKSNDGGSDATFEVPEDSSARKEKT